MSDLFIHEKAVVSPDCKIGKGTKIWINSQVREKCTIGSNTIISKDTYIDHGVSIGNNVKIQNGVSVYTGVTIEDDVFVGPNVTFTNDFVPRAFNSEWIITETTVEKGASLGANSTIICGTKIGRYSMVGAGSVVTKDVLPYTLVLGNPARFHSFICECGHKLNKEYICTNCGKELKDEICG